VIAIFIVLRAPKWRIIGIQRLRHDLSGLPEIDCLII